MSFTISGMLATTFAYTTEDFTFELSGGGIYTATVPAIALARVHLAPSASDLVRVVVSAMNATAPPLPGGVSFASSMGADGRLTITCTGKTWKSADLHTFAVGRILGYSVALSSLAAAHTAALQPMHVVYWISCTINHRRSRRQGGYATTHGGRVYGWAASGTSHVRRLAFDFVPRNPTIATTVSSPATALEPDDAYRDAYGSTATGRAWSWQDCTKVAPNSLVAFTSEFGTLRTSTSEKYDLGYLAPGALVEIEDEQLDPSWDAYHSLAVELHLPTSGSTGTRA